MGTTYYVDPAHGGTNAGTQANPWQSVQTAFDTAVAGDTVLCTGTQTLAANIDIDTNAGSTAGGHIKFFGCDAAWTRGAAQFVLDGNSAAANCLKVSGARHRYWIENFTLQNATSYNLNMAGDATAKSHWVFKTLISELSANHGGYTRYMNYSQFEQCIFRNNGGQGLSSRGVNTRFRFCTFSGNSLNGLYLNGTYPKLFGCLAYDNTAAGFEVTANKWATLINCVADDNDKGILLKATAPDTAIIACRVTNNATYGIDQESAGYQSNIEDWCVFYNNGGGGSAHRNNIAVGPNSMTAADATECGYIDQAGRNYGLTSDAIGRRIAVAL